MKKKNLGAVFLSMFLLAACGGNTKEETKAQEPKQAAVKPVKDTLVFAQITECKTLDPQDTTENYSQRIVTQVYDRLAEFEESTGNIVPGLAERWEKLDDNTMVFHLNKNVTFSNGDRFTAKDVKFSIERAKSLPKVGHLYKLIDRIEIIDDHTVKFITLEPFAPLLAHLTHKSASIVHSKLVQEDAKKYFENPIGTGSYRVKDWKMGDRIILEAVDTYFKGKPSIKNIVVRAIPEDSSKLIGLETGEIDISADMAAISKRTIRTNSNLTLLEKSSLSTSYVGMNTERGILKDPEVRKAIALGINRDDIIDAIMEGGAQKATGFLAPSVFGYPKDEIFPDYNREEAKKIIESKGLTGAQLKINVSNSSVTQQLAEIIQAQLKEIGIILSIEPLEWGTFLAETGKGNADLFSMGWGPSTGDGDYGLYPNFHSSQLGANGNRSRYSNPKMDATLEAARKEMDIDKRKGLYGEAIKILNMDIPAVPLYYGNVNMGIRNNVKGAEAASYPLFYKMKFED